MTLTHPTWIPGPLKFVYGYDYANDNQAGGYYLRYKMTAKETDSYVEVEGFVSEVEDEYEIIVKEYCSYADGTTADVDGEVSDVVPVREGIDAALDMLRQTMEDDRWIAVVHGFHWDGE